MEAGAETGSAEAVAPWMDARIMNDNGGCMKSEHDNADSNMRQIFLEVDCKRHGCGGRAPRLALDAADAESYPANRVPLNGAIVEAGKNYGESDPWDEEDAWRCVQKIADLCRAGEAASNEVPQRNALLEHLAYAYSILCDYVLEFDGDYTMSKETAETLIRGAMDRIVSAGKCFGFQLDKYRSDD